MYELLSTEQLYLRTLEVIEQVGERGYALSGHLTFFPRAGVLPAFAAERSSQPV